LRAEVSALEVRLAEAAAEAAASTELVASLKDAQLRLTADFENFRKRMVRRMLRSRGCILASRGQLSAAHTLSAWPKLAPTVDGL
jgi:molecular chaperone GrpE (heat shock protein)